MIKKMFLFLPLLAVLLTSCGPTIYKADTLAASQQKIKTVAILPFSISIDNKRLPKGVTTETLKESEEKTGYSMQNTVYTWFLKRVDQYTVKFQDVDRTNSILKKNNMSYDNISATDKAELCKMLGVDAVVSGKAFMSKPMSEGAAVAVGLLVGAWGPTNKTDVTLTIHDAGANLQWKYDYSASGSVGSSSERLGNMLMKNASKKFPYKKA